jgi:serine/threonine-protein kinase ATR
MNGYLLSYQSRSSRIVQLPPGFNFELESSRFARIDSILCSVSHRTIANRAAECKSYARAILHYEEDINQPGVEDVDTVLKQLQLIYEQIDEPDGIEGISARLKAVDLSQQVLDHKRSGRWTAALSYYEIAVQENPQDIQSHVNLLSCLKLSSQYGKVTSQV